MPKVTVIVPVYNVEKYIRKCIDSICSQTLTDIEIILVDDGSTDGSGNICDEYSEKDPRIRVIHKENEGLSCARNDGILASSSTYIMFVDGDDWVESDFCKMPYNVAVEYGADIVLFNHYIHYAEKVITRKVNFSEGIISKRQAMYINVECFETAWSGIYMRELFSKIKFPPGKYYEDVGTTHRLIYEAKTFYYIDKSLYHYLKNRPGSITTEIYTKEHPCRRELYITKARNLYNWGYDDLALKYAYEWVLRGGCRKNEQKEFLEIVRNTKCIPSFFSLKRKVMLIILRISPRIFDILSVVFRKRI